MTDAGGVLASYVTLRDPSKGFGLTTFEPGSTPPAWARPLITNPKAWESAPEESAPAPETPETPEVPEVPEGEATSTEEDLIGDTQEPAPAPEAETPEVPGPNVADRPSLPPKRGAGSGKEAWVAYAQAWDVDLADTATRDDIIAAVEAADGVPSE